MMTWDLAFSIEIFSHAFPFEMSRINKFEICFGVIFPDIIKLMSQG